MNPILVELTRGKTVECVHRGAIAVCNAAGALLASIGDTAKPAFPRSAFKALQALPLIESGAAGAFSVTDEELALACASHSGEAMHTERVAAWLERIDCKVSDLACGPHYPFYEPAAHDLIRSSEKPCRLHNNCSGKHTGFLTLARHLGVTETGYERPDHPVQLQVRDTIASLCNVKAQSMAIGIDGCAAPNYAIPLANIARAMAALAQGAKNGAQSHRRILAAWRNYPRLVSGTGRACADFIEASIGSTVVKTGAEGYFTAVLPEQGLGVALKIDDGATRAAETSMANILVSLGVADCADPLIMKHLNPQIANWRGEAVGERRASFKLS